MTTTTAGGEPPTACGRVAGCDTPATRGSQGAATASDQAVVRFGDALDAPRRQAVPAAPDDQVGSIAEETAKLVATLGEWVRLEVHSTVTAICQSVREFIDGAEADGRARSTAGFQTIDLDDPEGT